MKHKLKGVLGVGLTLVMVLSLTVAFVPVATAADYEENDWGTWGLPDVEDNTDVGPMAVAPDGTLFAAVLFGVDTDDPEDGIMDEWYWKVVKSDDDGYSWDDTEWDDMVSGSAGYPNRVVSIAISPNYEEDETLYVGVLWDDDSPPSPTVWRLEEAGDGDAIALKELVDSEGVEATVLHCIDVWTDEDDYNWIMAATDRDVLVLKDRTFEDWRDQELAAGVGAFWVAYEVAFAPDFDTSDLIWAVVDSTMNHIDDDNPTPPFAWQLPPDFMVTATASPGQWGQDIGEVDLDINNDLGINATPFVDIDFPDDYDSDPDSGDCNLYVGLSTGWLDYDPTDDGGGVWLIEGVDAGDGNSNAIDLFDLAGEASFDIIQIAVSGNYGDEVILAGFLNSSNVGISDDGGESWEDVDKSPTGEGRTHVYMEADVVWGDEVFDTDEGMAFAGTWGEESAVSRANDGGLVWNQVGYIDTELDVVFDGALHPEFPGTPTFILGTYCTAHDADSLWVTENGDTAEPDYMRVLCGTGNDPATPGNFEGYIWLVEYSQDVEVIYIFGEDDAGDESVWKSDDDGQTFGSRRDVQADGDFARINDWVIPDEDTILAAVDDPDGDGFYKTTNSGLSWTDVDAGGDMWSIAVSPDFDFDDEEGYICLGGEGNGMIALSDDAGDSFDDAESEQTAGLDGDVYVAFNADFADEDADGYMFIYAADDGADDDIMMGEVSDTDDVAWDPLECDEFEAPVNGDFYGLVVSEDNALYAIADTASYAPDNTIDFTDIIGVVRLLLDEDNSVWESQDDEDLTNPGGLQLSAGSNVLWTIDWTDAALWVLEDTCSGQVTLDSPSNGYQHDREDQLRVSWDEIRDADEYEVEYTHLDTELEITLSEIDDTGILLVELFDSSEYEWKVRVSPGEPWHSRWADAWTFYTALGEAPWAPELYAPGTGDTDVPLMPAFSWETANTADNYQFQLNDSPDFATLVDVKVSTEAYQIDFELEYDTTYYWRVKAFKGTKAISRWSEVSVFTTMAAPGPAPPAPSPPATVTQPAPAPIIMPTPIPPVLLWVIVGIGAALIIAVIILIVRTRRAV